MKHDKRGVASRGGQPPTICIIFEAIGPFSGIGRAAMLGVRIALDAGWKVTVIAKRLDEQLQMEVEWLRLYVPPRLFFLQWTTARHFIKSALGNRKFDVVHAHQPQVADLSDLFQCHFLTRAALNRKSLTGVVDARSAFVRLQEQGVLYVEDKFYRSWNAGTKMLYGSDLTRDDFYNLHGKLPLEGVLVHAFPTIQFPTDAERKSARAQYVGDYKGPVLGFLGGLHERKGYRRLVAGLRGDSDVMLLMGGQFSDGYTALGLDGRLKAVGLVHELKPFYDACDAVIVPSHYEPLGLVAFEAAARGLPVIATEEVGALPHLVEYGAGAEWKTDEDLTQVVKALITKREECNTGAIRMQQDLGMESYTHRLLEEYELIRTRGQRVEGAAIVK